MLDPGELFQLSASLPDLGRPVLVQALDGFVDAGNATSLAREHLLNTLDAELIVTFDVDQLYDYRARRPDMLFVSDHWESYTAPELTIHAVRDAAGEQFLLLSGPEPDAQWERFVAAIELIVHQLDARMLIGLNAIPMGVPHTRPSSVIAHGRPQELVAEYRNWLNTVQVPASVGHLLEFRLGEAALPSMGITVNVPHYLAHLNYPAAAVTLIECVAKAGDLELPTTALVEAAAVTRVEIDEQVKASEQVTAVVHALEQQYDGLMSGQGSLLAEGAALPTADEIGAEFEQYLSQQPPSDDSPE
jgi:proteasome assembly chaperone (PAC2) family protein